jgi:hypothetical protein
MNLLAKVANSIQSASSNQAQAQSQQGIAEGSGGSTHEQEFGDLVHIPYSPSQSQSQSRPPSQPSFSRAGSPLTPGGGTSAAGGAGGAAGGGGGGTGGGGGGGVRVMTGPPTPMVYGHGHGGSAAGTHSPNSSFGGFEGLGGEVGGEGYVHPGEEPGDSDPHCDPRLMLLLRQQSDSTYSTARSYHVDSFRGTGTGNNFSYSHSHSASADSNVPTLKLPNIVEPPSRLDEPSPEDTSLVPSYNIASPRAIFLTGCLKESIPPITVALLRKRISPIINLAHMGLGDKVARILASCLPSLPHLQLLNMADNNLGDVGLSAIIRSIAKHKSIDVFDISQNIIGSEAAGALAEYVGDPECRLQCLRMSNANIDDGECANFVEVLMRNRHLKVRTLLFMCFFSVLNSTYYGTFKQILFCFVAKWVYFER